MPAPSGATKGSCDVWRPPPTSHRFRLLLSPHPNRHCHNMSVRGSHSLVWPQMASKKCTSKTTLNPASALAHFHFTFMTTLAHTLLGSLLLHSSTPRRTRSADRSACSACSASFVPTQVARSTLLALFQYMWLNSHHLLCSGCSATSTQINVRIQTFIPSPPL